MIWLLIGFISLILGVGLWLLAGTWPWPIDQSMSPDRLAADTGWPFALFMMGLFYVPLIFGAFCLWRGFIELREDKNAQD